MDRVAGKVAFVTGAARGVGRAFALRLAQEGADVVVADVAGKVRDSGYPSATSEDLDETVRMVQAQGRRAFGRVTDVRDQAALDGIVAEIFETYGRLDIVGVNAGIMGAGLAWEIPEDEWDDVLAVNLTGAWKTVKACAPAMIKAGRGGSVIMTSSVAGLKGSPLVGHYTAAKHGMVGLMKTLANELAAYGIRVNTVNPSGIASAMGNIPHILALFEQHPKLAKSYGNALPVDRIEPIDVANALLFLASDEARYITGVCLPVDAGALNI